jgi:hypothetical protein
MMQIIVKVTPERMADAAEIVTRSVAETLPDRPREEVIVAPVFPGLTTGQRARLFSVNLPSDLSRQEVDRVVEALGQDSALEYAEIPPTKVLM